MYFSLKKELRWPHKLVYLPKQDLAAFTQIIDDSIFSLVKSDTRYVSHDMLIDKQELVGAYLIEPVKANRTILRSQLIIPPVDEITHQTRIVSIPVSTASAWHGEIATGEIVSIWIQPENAEITNQLFKSFQKLWY